MIFLKHSFAIGHRARGFQPDNIMGRGVEKDRVAYTAAESCAEKIERRLVLLGGGAALGGSRQGR